MTPQTSYMPSRCQAFFGCWIRPAEETELIAPAGWTWEHPEPGCYRIVPNPADVGDDLAQTILTAAFFIQRAPPPPQAPPVPPDTSKAGTLIAEIESGAYVVWTFNAQSVLEDIGVSVFVFAPMR